MTLTAPDRTIEIIADGSVTTTFTAAAIPAGEELSIGVFPRGATFGLVTAGTPLNCTSTSPQFG